MFDKVLKKLFGDKNIRDYKKIEPYLERIKEKSLLMEKQTDEELRSRISEIRAEIKDYLNPSINELDEMQKTFQQEHEEGEKERLEIEIDRQNKEIRELRESILNQYLPEVFAIVKETCCRLIGTEYEVRGHQETWFMVPFDVQLVGAIALHQGMITEMATGEGKTLVATMPLFLNALTGLGVHLITVNDYLAQRDSEWMRPIFEFHNLSVGVITTGMDFMERKAAYSCDITYGTNSEFGFDYLRDNMATNAEQLVQGYLYYAIIDEVDSVLIDEARTPLIISGPVAESKNFYAELKPQIVRLATAQTALVNRYMSEVRQMLDTDNPNWEEVGRKLLLVKRAAPRNKAYQKLMKDGELKKLVNDMEGIYLRDKKMHILDEDLFYVIDEKSNSADLCDKGRDELSKNDPQLFVMEQLDDLLDELDQQENLSLEQKMQKKEEITTQFLDKNERLHNIAQLIKSYSLFEKDVDYVVVNNQVVIVDEFTGRMMPGRRFSDGLHQALEAKEGVKIEGATQTLATITLQNYFRMYDKIAGMTGTAVTEEAEFMEIYKLPVMVIPTNLPVTRIDYDDMIYLTKKHKYDAIMNEISYWHDKGKPVLVGTVSVEVSETLSRLLTRRGIKHNVLNAKNHEQEAEIIIDAGEPGAVTIATNMAGRGTDIKLGKGVITQLKEEYRKMSPTVSDHYPYGIPEDGLHVIGTERHESRRIDRQLRGRSGRQGDPGSSRFYLSLEDDLMRLFGSDRIAPMMTKFGLKEGDAITHPWMTNAVEKAQKRVEGHNFEIRKQLLKYDEVMNQQREVIYKYRRSVLKGYDLKYEIMEMISESIERMVDSFIMEGEYQENWAFDKIVQWLKLNLAIVVKQEDLISDYLTLDILKVNIEELVFKAYQKREEDIGEEQLRKVERLSLLQVVDTHWRDHLHEMDLLKEGVSFRAYANKDPLIEYKKESFILFQSLIANIQDSVTKRVFTVQFITSREQLEDLLRVARTTHSDISAFHYQSADVEPQGDSYSSAPPSRPQKIQPRRVEAKVGRNDPCPCGSGKKYKKCCGAIEN
ncbi:MAG: preprotein translocase subunit SecA [Candidatus Cloacimonetes bacterium]|nr:preprotein translocase subunit SecA [Candidatus Cloacimonadota bacterium]